MQNLRRRLTAGSIGGLLALAAVAPETWAQSAPQSERLAYSMMLGGLHVGDAVVELDQDHDSYSTGLKLTARGVAKFLREFRADLSGHGSLSAQENVLMPLPARYSRAWSGAEIDSSMATWPGSWASSPPTTCSSWSARTSTRCATSRPCSSRPRRRCHRTSTCC